MTTEKLKHYQVAILCGGRGTRLKPATDLVPKALVEINGRPILDYIIDFYSAHEIRDFILCIGYKGEQIREYFRNSPSKNRIQFSDVGEDASMLERIWHLNNLMGERLFVSYCDTFIDLDLDHMLGKHLRQKAWATIVTAKIRNPFGLLSFDSDGWVTSFIEKPFMNYYIGCFLLEKSALKFVSQDMLQKKDGQGLVDFFLELINRKKLAAFEHTGDQITFNTEPERQKAEEYLGRFYTYSEDV
jgi:glucose-1-phosphate cytidylyltransferase